MIAKSVVVAVALFSSSIALAASSAIGTVSTRGEIRVGGYAVRGTATLFDNTALETSDFAATLRLDRGTEIKLAGGSSGTLPGSADPVARRNRANHVNSVPARRERLAGITERPQYQRHRIGKPGEYRGSGNPQRGVAGDG